MKIRIFILIACLVIGGLAASPLPQEVPPRPIIQLDGNNGQVVDGQLREYCWAIAANDTQCDFDLPPTPTIPLVIPEGQQLTVLIQQFATAPTVLTLEYENTRGVSNVVELNPAINAIVDQPLPLGTNNVTITAEYANVAGSEGFVSYAFTVSVEAIPPIGAGGAETTEEPTDEPTQEVAAATEEATAEPAVTEEPTQEVMAETEEPTEEPTQEVAAATEEAPAEPVVTEEPTQEVMAATEETTEEPTQEVAAATEEATAEPVVTEEPTQEVMAATEEPTEEPTQEVATEEATAEPVVPATEEPTEEPSTDAMAPTATTVPLSGAAADATDEATTEPTQEPEVAVNPTLTTVPLVSNQAESDDDSAVTVQNPDTAPTVGLVSRGVSFVPTGGTFCQQDANGEQVCEDIEVTEQPGSIVLIGGTAAQIELPDAPQPSTVEVSFRDASTLQVADSDTRPGANVVLFNVDASAGNYILQVKVVWGTTSADYFFRVQVQ